MKEPKYTFNDRVDFNGKIYYVRGISIATQCHPEIEFIYELSELENRTSVTNETAIKQAHEKDLMTVEESCIVDLKEIAHFFGGWDKLKEIVENLEQSDSEATYERMHNRG